MPVDSLSFRAVAVRACLLILGWVVLVAVFVGAGHVVVGSRAINGFDRHITTWVVAHRTLALDVSMRMITWIGSWIAVAATAVVVLVAVVTKRLMAVALGLLAVIWAGENAAFNVVKHLIGRPRPPRGIWLAGAGGWSFPSGHAANATAVCASATIVVFLVTRRGWVRMAMAAMAFLVVALVAFSRVELGVHWTTDVVAGGLLGAVWLALVVLIFAGTLRRNVPEPDGTLSRGDGGSSGSAAGMR